MSTTITAGNATNNGASIASDTAGKIEIKTGSTPTTAVTIDTSQNVGIGTASPDGKLHIASAGVTKLVLENTLTTGPGTHDVTFMGYKPTVGYDNIVHDFASYIFKTSNTERMRIDSSGNLLVGTTNSSPVTNGVNGIAINGTSLNLRTPTNTNLWGLDATSGNHIRFFTSGVTAAGIISSNGATTTYGTSSDYRMKENIAPMTGALDVVQQLKPVTYTWKPEFSGTKSFGQGFIAHELQAVVPDCVTGEKDAVDVDGNPVYQGIDTSFLVATLTAAIKELNAKVDAQATEIAALKGAK